MCYTCVCVYMCVCAFWLTDSYRLCCSFRVTADFWSLLWNIYWQTWCVYSYSQFNVVLSIWKQLFHQRKSNKETKVKVRKMFKNIPYTTHYYVLAMHCQWNSRSSIICCMKNWNSPSLCDSRCSHGFLMFITSLVSLPYLVIWKSSMHLAHLSASWVSAISLLFVITLPIFSLLIRAVRCDNATREPLCFAAVYFFSFFLSFFFSARSPCSFGRSPQNFATRSEMGAILKKLGPKFGGPKKFGAEKHAFLAAISDDFALRSQISRTEQDIDNWKPALQTTISPASADTIWWT